MKSINFRGTIIIFLIRYVQLYNNVKMSCIRTIGRLDIISSFIIIFIESILHSEIQEDIMGFIYIRVYLNEVNIHVKGKFHRIKV